ncbi:hypothetical protein LCGC14_0410920 [marine sediment metagenome]|uniref:DNA primase/nucleoside triphosphatase C-terminal domain-containing protein n=1 Tax=marine sediment metagenome TaxID=412755 RepID=A0A0F9VFP1_9ZZZZ
MKYLLETDTTVIIEHLMGRTDVKLTPMDENYFKPSLGRPLKAVQVFCNAFCEITGEVGDRISKRAFRERYRAYLETQDSRFGLKTNAKIGREAKKYCGLETKVARYEGKPQRCFVGVKFRE